MSNWIRFDLIEREDMRRKTDQWRVVSTSRMGVLLGRIAWYGSWRKFSFMPNSNLPLVFEEDCLRDIADFCVQQTKKYRSRRASQSLKPEAEREK